MLRRTWALSLAFPLAVACAGCKARDTEALARLCQKAGHKFEALAGGPDGRLSGGWHAVRGAMGDAALDSRVATRLRWDRYLADADIQVSQDGPGTVALHGEVTDASHRQRALELARSTAGVEQVLDHLTVAAPAGQAKAGEGG
jgi:hypothetical protein